MLRKVRQSLSSGGVVQLASVMILTISLASCGDDDPGPAATLPNMAQPPPPETTVMVDRAHNNGHHLGTTLGPLATMLSSAGYSLISSELSFNSESLARGSVLVISNALHQRNASGDWSLPTPSAFSDEEIQAVQDWVQAGGSLLLIADHMPFPGAAEALAAAFGVAFKNGFAFDASQIQAPVPCLLPRQIQIFRRSDGSLADHVITNGRNAGERVDSVATFTGQAFEPDGVTTSLFTFGLAAVIWTPEVAWQFDSETPELNVEGWRQGAVLESGLGRVALFGEAAMFTEQTCGNDFPMGMNAPAASQNRQFIINLFRWLFRDL